MVDSTSQAEYILEHDGDIRCTRTTAAGRKRGPSETAEQTEVHLPGDWLRIGTAEPVRLGSSGRFAWQPTVIGSSAAGLRKRFSSADLGLNASGPRRHSAWQLKQRNSGQPG